MKAKFVIISLLLVNSHAVCAEDSGYVSITEIKSWNTKNDIYLSVGHNCGGSDIGRYHLSKDDDQQYSLLLSAFASAMVVNVNYSCGSNGYPMINGVRARK